MAINDPSSPAALASANKVLAGRTALDRIQWALSQFSGSLVLSTSFGAQSAVMLDLATQLQPDIPVILIDTGYLFPETYRFADELTTRLKLNLKVYRPQLSAAWLEARHGRLWEAGEPGIAQYNQQTKIEPMQRALKELGAAAWLAGLRRTQASSRAQLPIVGWQEGRAKVLPIVDWTDRQILEYLYARGLPCHPLWSRGYVSIGDIHTTRPLTADLTAEQTRFFGLQRECGLHEASDQALS
jgi:phosphoadenosine phosphosulfate reductase